MLPAHLAENVREQVHVAASVGKGKRMIFGNNGDERRKPSKTTEICDSAVPFIWPEPRWHAGHVRYPASPPYRSFFADADLVSGVLVDVANSTVDWIKELAGMNREVAGCFVIVLYPACPTRQSHLERILDSVRAAARGSAELEFRVLAIDRSFGHDHELSVVPPTILQAHQSQTGKTFLCVGSSGDFGHNAPCLASFNLVFQPDDALRDAYRRWFEYLRRRASPLTAETTAVPHLVPAHGASDAAELWRDFQRLCSPTSTALVAEPIVDPETGEVTAPDGHAGPPAWDGGRTALDPLARELQRVYAEGALVTVDESTRVKPLAIPVKATLLGQASERSVGALKHKQSFKLEVLDDAKGKEVEKCRKATDVIDLLSFLLSKGNRWIPTPAKALLDKELEARNTRGLACLGRIVGQSIDDFVKRREPEFAKDLNDMYRALGQGDSVPEDKLQAVLRDVKARLARPSETRIAPRAVYNRIAPPDLTSSAADDNWSQPFSLLHRAARLFRESLTDPYFPRKFSGLSFTQQEFDATLDVFGDSILKDRNTDRARAELVTLRDIEASDMPFRAKCHAVWEIIKGAAAAQRATS